MGTIEKGVECETCSMDYTKCKGHFGHIALAIPVVNPICHLLKTTQMDSELHLQKLQEDSDNKAASQP